MPESRSRKPKKGKPPNKAKVVDMYPDELPELFPVTSSLGLIINQNKDNPRLLTMLFEMIEHYRKEYHRNRKEGPATEVIKEFYNEADRFAADLMGRAPEISCRKGCAHCCHITVNATENEVDLILEYIKENDIPVDMEWLRQQQGFTEETHMMSPFSKCVFLKENNECGIYPVRPMSCRKYFVSTAPELCNAKLYAKGRVDCQADFTLECMATALLNVGSSSGTLSDLLYEKLTPDEEKQ